VAETWNTLDYLTEAGIRYVCDWVNDDQSYQFEIGTPPLVSLPYSVQTNDVPAYFEMKASVPEFEAMLKRQFDTLYREGETVPRVMAIAVHPFVTARAENAVTRTAPNTAAKAIAQPPVRRTIRPSRAPCILSPFPSHDLMIRTRQS
jgi:hypothetical protein